MSEDYITINFDWLKLEDYQFKILILIKMLASDTEQRNYVGTIKDMEKWLHIGNSTKNNKKIEKAIEELKNAEIIDFKKEKGKYNVISYDITILEGNNRNVLKSYKKVDKKDIETIRKYVIDNNKTILGNMLKIYIFALYNYKIIDYASLGILLNILTDNDMKKDGKYKTNKISNAIRTLKECKFEDNTYFESERKYFVNKETNRIKGLGSLITANKQFK